MRNNNKQYRFVYADNAAATPLAEHIASSMGRVACEYYGNPSSMHSAGRDARSVLDCARSEVADLLQALPEEIIFTSGGSEANNLALRGVVATHGNTPHMVVSSIEHPSVLKTAQDLQKRGLVSLTIAPVDEYGRVGNLTDLVRDDTVLVSIMHTNNEIGTEQSYEEIMGTLSERRARTGLPFVHADACRAADSARALYALGVDLITVNGSKIYGPRGVGILLKRNNVLLAPCITGGGQEFGLRAGTENLPAIVGMAEALNDYYAEHEEVHSRLIGLRKKLIAGFLAHIPGIIINGHPEYNTPYIVHVTVPRVEGESMLLMLEEYGIIVATGSACSSRNLHPSHVLQAIGQDERMVHGSVRFSFGRDTTEEDIDYIMEVFPRIVKRLREISSVK